MFYSNILILQQLKNKEIVSLTNRAATITIFRAEHDSKVKRNTMKVGNEHHVTIIITIELNLFWTTGSHVLRDPDRATNCNKAVLYQVTPIRPITNRKSEPTNIICFLSLSVFDPQFTLLSLPVPQLSSAFSRCTHATIWSRHELDNIQ